MPPALPPDATEENFLRLMDSSRDRLEALVHEVSPDGLHAPLDAAGWSTLDHLAHLGVWEQSMADLLAGHPRYEAMRLPREVYESEDIDHINAEIRAWTSQLSTAQQLELFSTAHVNLMAAIERVGWDGLLVPYANYDPTQSDDPDGDPVLYWVLGNGPGHFDDHARWIRQIHGMTQDEQPVS